MRTDDVNELRPMPSDQAMTLYELRDRVFIGSSIGYYKMNVIETFEDRDLALKECENIRRNNSQSYAHVVTVES